MGAKPGFTLVLGVSGEVVPKKLGTISPGEVVPGYDFSGRNRTQQY
jgi:hypothetical protein